MSIIVLLILFLLGFSWRIPAVARLDERAFLALYGLLSRPRGREFFRLLWPLGTTPAALAALLFLGLPLRGTWQAWGELWFGFALAALAERLTKMSMRRPRPFTTLPGVLMHQPRRPKDPSFPSGDALRIWFLAGVLSRLYPAGAALWYALGLLVSLGRIALGVHHPLDVLAGGALGALAAALSLSAL